MEFGFSECLSVSSNVHPQGVKRLAACCAARRGCRGCRAGAESIRAAAVKDVGSSARSADVHLHNASYWLMKTFEEIGHSRIPIRSTAATRFKHHSTRCKKTAKPRNSPYDNDEFQLPYGFRLKNSYFFCVIFLKNQVEHLNLDKQVIDMHQLGFAVLPSPFRVTAGTMKSL